MRSRKEMQEWRVQRNLVTNCQKDLGKVWTESRTLINMMLMRSSLVTSCIRRSLSTQGAHQQRRSGGTVARACPTRAGALTA